MKINYLLPPDDDLRAKAVTRAVFEDFNTEIGEYKGDVTLTISDKAPCYLIFDGAQTKHPVIGWRLAAKQFSETIFGVKCNVVKVGAAAEQYYIKAAKDKQTVFIDPNFNKDSDKYSETALNKKSVIIQSSSQSVDNQRVMEDDKKLKELGLLDKLNFPEKKKF